MKSKKSKFIFKVMFKSTNWPLIRSGVILIIKVVFAIRLLLIYFT